MLNGTSVMSNVNVARQIYSVIFRRPPPAELPLKTLFDSKLSTQDQLADVISLLIVPSIATSFHICAALRMSNFPQKAVISLWQRFGVLLFARLFSGLITEEIFRRRLQVLFEADKVEMQLVPE